MPSSLAIASLLLLLPAANGLAFPCECVRGPAFGMGKWNRTCCPMYKSSTCGSALGRGNCLPVPTSFDVGPINVGDDDRLKFPKFYFDYTCQCKYPYFGYNCGECFPGWKGDLCNVKVTYPRKNILSYTPTELEQLHATLHYFKYKIDPEFCILRTADRLRRETYEFIEVSYYDMLVFIHTYVTRQFIRNGEEVSFINPAHGSTNFLGWHRWYLILFERQVNKCMKTENFRLPYFAWDKEKGYSVCTDDFMGASGPNGRISRYSVYSEWHIMCAMDYAQTVCITEDCACERPRLTRMPGFANYYRPTLADVNECLARNYLDTAPYDDSSVNSYRNCEEELHNLMHVLIGGVMELVSISSNDPLFWLHHCNVDRHWEIYLVNGNYNPTMYPSNDREGHRGNDCVIPFLSCTRNSLMVQTCSNFGYTYS